MTTLEQLPGRMDRLESQILQLRADTRDEFSAVRADMRSIEATLRSEIQSAAVSVTTAVTMALTEQIEESRRHARVLFEEYVGRLATIREGTSKRPRKR